MHTLMQTLITHLRRKELTRAQFRYYAHQLAQCLAQQAVEHLKPTTVTVATPFGKAEGIALNQPIVLVPILRSGLVLLPAFIELFPDAGIGCVGLRRDEKTAIATLYYNNIPKLNGEEQIIMLDPMIATGGSSCSTLEILTKQGVAQRNILFVAVIAAQQGLDVVKQSFPGINIIVAAVDKELNPKKFIVPGLGDFGDRYFGTE
ncbi:MAG: uracil phosphoribosyltransferase [Candidatus Babeliales bacterium]